MFAFKMHTQPDDQQARGATPFDSGGLWHGCIKTAPALTDSGKQQLFRKKDVLLTAFPSAFENYIFENYDAIRDYVEGKPPRIGTRPIMLDEPNSTRAWTWEVRIPRSIVSKWAELVGGFITQDDMNDCSDWLTYDSAIEDAEAEEILRWANNNMRLSPPGDAASKFAEKSLLAGEIA